MRGYIEAGYSIRQAGFFCGLNKNQAVGLNRRHIQGIKESHRSKRKAQQPAPKPAPPPQPPPPPPPLPAAWISYAPCRWPFGDPKRSGFRFCGADAVPGLPYCVGHCRAAYAGKWAA